MFLRPWLPCSRACVARYGAAAGAARLQLRRKSTSGSVALGQTWRIAAVDISALLRRDDASGSRQAAKQLSDAFADTGFAIVIGTGVSTKQMARLRGLAYQFFEQGLDAKNAVNDGHGEGYGEKPYCYLEENGAQLLGDFSRPTDIVESLTYRGLSELEVQAQLPQSPAGLKEEMMEFNDSLAEMRRALEKTCELALGLEDGFLGATCLGGQESLRLAYYPNVPASHILDGQMRYGAHVDSFGLTVLSLDPASPGGLQVNIDNAWVDVPFVEGSVVLNVGALLSRWTNGRWQASVHRVLCNPGARLSIVSGAVRPRDDVLIEVFPSCRQPAGAPGGEGRGDFPPVLASDFYAERVAMHRPSYLQERGLSGQSVQQISDDIRNYRI